MARDSEYTTQGTVYPSDWRGCGVAISPRDVAPPGASLAGDAVSLVNGLSRLHEALTTLNDRLHGPRPRPAPDNGKAGSTLVADITLRLTLDRALALVSACEAGVAEAMGRL